MIAEASEEEAPETEAKASEHVPFAPWEFLLDAGIFLALCLPVAAIAFGIVRLRKRGKKVQNEPEP